MTILLPDHPRSELTRALHLLYNDGHAGPLAAILGEPQVEQEDSLEDSLEEDDGMAISDKLGQSSEFLTSTKCKRSPIKSIVRESVEGLGLCFVSPISKDYEEEPESGEQEVTLIFLTNK